jgi:Flp pilus assembly protein TadB
MSRAERRAYKRLTKNQDPYALPAAAQRGRGGRPRQRRPQRPSGEFQFVTGRFLAWALGGAAVAGLLGLSVAWPNGMPLAAYVGLAVAVAWLGLAWVVRTAQRRAASQRPPAAPG